MKYLILSFLSLLIFILTACSNKQLPTKKSHYNGLYNALTMDYSQKNKNLDNNLSQEEAKYIDLNNSKMELESDIDSLQSELKQKEELLISDQENIKEIEIELKKMDTLLKTKPLIQEVDKKIIKMHKSIK